MIHLTLPPQPPENLFHSEFVIAIFGRYVKWCKGSCHDYGHLVGALAMTAAGVSIHNPSFYIE
jgi:hypothetical protein